MILDFVHYRLYKEIVEYRDVVIGCDEYFARKERQLLDFLLKHKAKLKADDKKTLQRLLKKHKVK